MKHIICLYFLHKICIHSLFVHIYPSLHLHNPLYLEVLYLHLHTGIYQCQFQNPKMEVLYHIGPYFVGIPLLYLALTQALHVVGTSNLGT